MTKEFKEGNYTREQILELQLQYRKEFQIWACKYCGEPYIGRQHYSRYVCPMCRQAKRDLWYENYYKKNGLIRSLGRKVTNEENT